MRNASLEILDETRKRKENDAGEGQQKKSRRSIFRQNISYFSEKHECKISLRQEKLKLKRQELDLQAIQIQQAQPTQQAQFLLSQVRNFKSMNYKQ